MSKRQQRIDAARGFVLVAVVWLLAALSLVAAAIALWVQNAVQQQSAFDDRAQAAIDGYSTRQAALYWLLTRRMTVGGLAIEAEAQVDVVRTPVFEDEEVLSVGAIGNELRMDGTAYQGIGTADFALQDERGLLNVNYGNDIYWSRFLGYHGVPYEDRAPLIATLADYSDPDDLYRLNGAERYQYERAERSGPANRPLATPGELRRVLGWERASLPVPDDVLLDNLSTSLNGAVNINTAPLSVLLSTTDFTSDEARRIIAARTQAPINNASELTRIAGRGLAGGDDEGYLFFPSRFVSITVWQRDKPERIRYHVELTPFAPQGMPWRTRYTSTLLATPTDDEQPALRPPVPLDGTQALFSRER